MFSVTALLYITLFLLACYATLFHDPYFGILLYQVQYFANPVSHWWYAGLPDIRYSYIIIIIICISILIHRNRDVKSNYTSVPMTKWVVLLGLNIIVTYIWAVSPSLHVQYGMQYFKIIVYSFLAYKIIDTPKKMEALLGVYLTGIFYLSLICWQLGRTGGGRLEGVGGADTTDANGAAVVVVTAVPLLAFYILFGKNNWIKIAALGCMIFVLNSLILLNSRGAFLALVVGGIYFFIHLLLEKKRGTPKIKLITGVIIIIVLFVYLADNIFWSRMSSLERVDTDVSESDHRITFWLKTFEMLENHPLGMGARGYDVLSPYYLPAEWLSGGIRSVHSTWFEVLSEYGYHGLIIFLGYILSSIMFIRKARKYLRSCEEHYILFQSIALESAFVSLLVGGSFINFFYGELMSWLPFYMAAFDNIYYLKAVKDNTQHPVKKLQMC